MVKLRRGEGTGKSPFTKSVKSMEKKRAGEGDSRKG